MSPGIDILMVRKRAQIRNRYNQAPLLTQDTNGSDNATIRHYKRGPRCQPLPSKASINRRTRNHNKKDSNNINDPQKKHRLGTLSKNILLEGLNQFHGPPTSPLVQMWIKTQTQNINNTNVPQNIHFLVYLEYIKVEKTKLRNPYNQVLYRAWDTILESKKQTRNHHIKENQHVLSIPSR